MQKCVLILSFFTLVYSLEVGDIVITEYFSRSNDDIPDYIEIYNSSSNEIILSNILMELTNNAVRELPNYSLNSNDYVLLISAEGLFRDEDGNIYLPEDDPRRNPANEMYNDGYENAPILPNSILIGDDDENLFFVQNSVNNIKVLFNDLIIDEISWNNSNCENLESEEECESEEFSNQCKWIYSRCLSSFLDYGNICSDPQFDNRNDCENAGFEWSAFNKGFASEFVIDPSLSDSFIANDNGDNWSKSYHTPYFMFNDESDDAEQEYGSPGCDNLLGCEELIDTGTILVPQDYPTIQAGIDAASDGDTVLVAAGTYYENINFNGKNIAVIGEDRETTIIDGGQNGSVVQLQYGGGFETLLSSFTLQNGSDHYGGGINLIFCDIKLKNLIIRDNSSTYGGGVSFGASDPIFENVIIINNIASYRGGGLHFYNVSYPQFTNISITGNSANEGGGVFAGDNSASSFINANISSNSADKGGGIYHSWSSDMNLVNVTNAYNTAIEGCAIYQYFADLTMINCILWNNPINEVYLVGYNENNDASISIGYSNINGNETSIISNQNSTISWLEGNINFDPQFTDPENGDFTLQPTSPCIDAGDPNSPLDPDGTIADMGAYYFHQIPGCTDSSAINYNSLANINDGSCYHDTVNDIDGNEYQAVQIGEQLWMKENLKVTHYSNGDEIPNLSNNNDWCNLNTNGAYCDYNNEPSNSEVYGRIYNWFAATDERNICPENWHIPNSEDFEILESFLGNIEIGAILKDTGTIEDDNGLWYSPNTGASNELGFSAIPSGSRTSNDGQFLDRGYSVGFWYDFDNSQEYNGVKLLRHDSAELTNLVLGTRGGLSIRCVADNDILGCTTSNACNYNPEATEDDGSCIYAEEFYDCDGNCIAELDCLGECGGLAVIDECGVCDGDGSSCAPYYTFVDIDCRTMEVVLSHSFDLSAFQFDYQGFQITEILPIGSTLEYDFEISFGSNRVIGFSYTGGVIPAGESILFRFTYIPIENEACIYDVFYSEDDLNFIEGESQCRGINNDTLGCTEINAINYDQCAIIDDNSCLYNFNKPLNNGSNLISFWALPEDKSIANVFSNVSYCVSGVIGEGVAASNLGNCEDGGCTWVGSLSEISPTSGYWVIADYECNLSLEGYMEDNLVYELNEGTNLISYPFPGSMDISLSIPDIAEGYFTGIIGEGVAASQIAPQTWVGSLNELQGGNGYWVKVTYPFEFSFTHPDSVIIVSPQLPNIRK